MVGTCVRRLLLLLPASLITQYAPHFLSSFANIARFFRGLCSYTGLPSLRVHAPPTRAADDLQDCRRFVGPRMHLVQCLRRRRRRNTTLGIVLAAVVQPLQPWTASSRKNKPCERKESQASLMSTCIALRVAKRRSTRDKRSTTAFHRSAHTPPAPAGPGLIVARACCGRASPPPSSGPCATSTSPRPAAGASRCATGVLGTPAPRERPDGAGASSHDDTWERPAAPQEPVWAFAGGRYRIGSGETYVKKTWGCPPFTRGTRGAARLDATAGARRGRRKRLHRSRVSR